MESLQKKIEKNEIRKNLRTSILKMEEENKRCESSLVCREFINSKFYAECKSFFSYSPLNSEVDVSEINCQILKDKKSLFLPRCNSDGTMEFYKISSEIDFFNQVEKGYFGIYEPKKNLQKVSDYDFEDSCFLVPGLGFSYKGARIGKGKGYYDKYFLNLKLKDINSTIVKIGIHFSCQILKDIPSESHDMKMNFLLGPEGFVISDCH